MKGEVKFIKNNMPSNIDSYEDIKTLCDWNYILWRYIQLNDIPINVSYKDVTKDKKHSQKS